MANWPGFCLAAAAETELFPVEAIVLEVKRAVSKLDLTWQCAVCGEPIPARVAFQQCEQLACPCESRTERREALPGYEAHSREFTAKMGGHVLP
jgi:hypothetical protein